MSTATILFFLGAAALVFFGLVRKNVWPAFLGGLMTAIGLGSVWPHWIPISKTAINATAINIWHWLTTAFAGASAPHVDTILILIVGALLFFFGRKRNMLIAAVIGAVAIIFALITFCPHLGPVTVVALQTQFTIIKVWATTAY